ncbi:MAG: RibD family protein [Hydrogenophaga sp.]|jgi:riboflavin-specific deaminase-like protein|nr:RibD family protein [Hydrogenophaga sp.]
MPVILKTAHRPASSPDNRPGGETDAVTDVPADWPELWGQMLAARSGQPMPATRRAAVVWGEATGWTVKGPCSARSATLFDVYKPALDARSRPASGPWLVAQMGQSLDGFVATSTGDSYFVNGPHSLVHLHRLRALCDAVIVGAGTVATDNPQLTTRRVPGPNPARVLIDPAARLDGRARALVDGQARTLWVCDARHADRARACAPQAEVLSVDGLLDDSPGGSCYSVHRAVAALAEQGLRVLFVEGGGVTVSRFFAAGALHRLHLSVAPVLIGEGRRGLQVPARPVMADCPRPPARRVALGDDMLWDLDLSSLSPAPAG